MGEVYLANSPEGGDVVVKVIRAEIADTDHARRRFAREIAAARRVNGYRTARVVEAAPDADPPWMATEYIPGPSLHRLIHDRGPFSPANVRALAADLCVGLAAIHACGLVHRDLKPSNVIIAHDGARIIDFGLARMRDASSLTGSGAMVGTYAFMSPEQIRAGDIGPASDVFSLGGVLTFASTGRGPFDAAAVPAIIHRILTAEPALGPVSAELRQLLAACLAKNPADRPTTTDLLNWLHGDGDALRVPTADTVSGPDAPTREDHGPKTSRPTPVARRRLLLAGLGGLAGAAAVTVPAVMLSTRGSDATARGGPRASSPPARQVYAGVLTGHDAVVTQLAFGPDGTSLITGGADGLILVWDTTTGRRVRALRGFSYPLVSIAVGPDGRTMTAGAEDVRTWDLTTGRVVRSISTHGRTGFDTPLSAMASSPDGRHLATDGAAENALLWDTTTGKIVRTFTGHSGAALAFTPDGRALAGGGRRLELWDVAGGTIIRTFTGFAGQIGSISLSRDGRLLAAGGKASPVLLWDLATARKVREFTGMGNSTGPIAFSPDGRLVATAPAEDAAGAEEITLWEVTTGRTSRTLNGHTGAVTALAFHPGGTALASTSQDRTARLWRLN